MDLALRTPLVDDHVAIRLAFAGSAAGSAGEIDGIAAVPSAFGTGEAGNASRTLAIRADMDALPIQETSDLPYRSCNSGETIATRCLSASRAIPPP